MSSHALRWSLSLVTSIFACAGPSGPAHAGTTYDEFEERPAEFFCTMSPAGRGEVCVRLYLDEDGYELCLSDDVARTERCTSYYTQPGGGGEEYDAPAKSAVRLING